MIRLILGLLLAGSAFGAQSPSTLITNIPGRNTVSLNGAWHAIVDPFDNGKGRFFRDAKPKDKSDLVEYSFDASPVLNIPGDWNSQREDLMFYEGPVWYRREFSYHKHSGKREFVYFGAANYQTVVYLNGEKLGEHEGGFTPFNLEATSLLHEGENSLIVEVSNARRVDAVPTVKFDWWNYGGITRDVSLVEVPAVFVQDYSVQLSRGSQSEIAGWVQLSGTSSQKVTLEIPEAGIREAFNADASGRAEFHFTAKLDLWSPDRPKLYDVILASGEDVVHDQIGFRSIEVRGAQILLNGKPIFLRGVSMHEEAPFRGGRAFSPEDAKTLLGWVKELGCNFVRFAHYPHNENEIRAADRMGLLVWSEIPVYWDIDWSNPATLANAEAQLRDMIARDRNRAAVILWSISNETPVKPKRLTFLKQLAQDAHALDSTRLITSALNHTENSGGVRTLTDPLGEFLDVLGLNEYVGWYEGNADDMDAMKWQTTWNKPLIVSEFGGGAIYGRHGDAGERWTEEYQENLFRHQLGMVEKMPNLAGMTPWVLMDFRSPLRMLPGVQDYHNRKGLISDRGQRKLAFYVLQGFYRKLAEAGK
ncbi:MAG TPA: glycoside hydrolase family 2 TIM barrel-domain containing protein [Candidatus Sulfotelmatobacter sp.]